MKAQVLFVAPFKKLADDARLVINERFEDVKDLIKVVEADLKEAEDIVDTSIGEGIEVIVSRGGTAKFLEKELDIPILCVQVTITDILQSLLSLNTMPKNIGISGFSNMIYGAEELSKIFNIKFTEILINEECEAEHKIREAIINNHLDLTVGDAISVKIAKKNKVKGQFINSGKQSIFRALQEALLIARVRRQDEQKSQIIREIIKKSHDGIIVVDEKDKINLFNPQAEKILHKLSYEVLGKNIKNVASFIDDKKLDKDEELLLSIYNKQYLIKKSELFVKSANIGKLYTLQNISEMQKIERNIRKKLSSKGLVAKYFLEDIIGSSVACEKMKHKAKKYALTNSTILITGESGTGKEMLVQSIHNISDRAQGPFVALNCAALPENLLESELFGYVDGAFTGAKRGGRQGMFELAHGGTLFLDEIGEMPLSLQSRLLRVLQERQVMPLGGESVMPIDVRIIAATNQNLSEMIEKGTFRSDLYYRLNILRIHMPTLLERKEDIPLLADSLILKMKDINPNIKGIDKEAKNFLSNCQWPGNIRQFVNMMERIMLLSDGAIIKRQDVINAYEDDNNENNFLEEEQSISKNELKEEIKNKNLAEMEIELLKNVLIEENYNYSKAAKRLGIHRTTLWRKLKQN